MNNYNIYVVDEMMGRGKTTAIINHINHSSIDDKYLIITPYISEVDRYKKSCVGRNFKEPKYKNNTKLNDIKELLSKGENVVSTHALFSKFNDELIDICRANNYTLVMDEVAEVICCYEISDYDFEILKKDFITIDEKTSLIHWRESQQDYQGEFIDIKNLCNLGCLAYYSKSIMMWLFPIEVFNSFRTVYILTYMFNAQLQRHYYDYYGLKYNFLYVSGHTKETYALSPTYCPDNKNTNYKELIHILDNEKMNRIGDRRFDLSTTWYDRNKNNGALLRMKNNLINFFNNIKKSNSRDSLWTTLIEYKALLSGKSYTKGFLPLNMRATNDYGDRHMLAYTVNRFMNPFIKNFFSTHNVDVDEDGYALSEMLQWIWRSAIRNGEEIYIYIPSIRMRELLIDWIDKNSK